MTLLREANDNRNDSTAAVSKLSSGLVYAQRRCGELVCVSTGQAREVVIKSNRVSTGIYKTPVQGPVRVFKLNLEGDVRVEKRKFGEEHHAIYAYPYEHYDHWQEQFDRHYESGQFGENLTVRGMLEDSIRIGDVIRCGSAVLQVTSPRIPCRKLNQRMGFRFAPEFLRSRRTGYYLRVLQEGVLEAGATLELLESDPNSPTVDEFVRVSQFDYWDHEGLQNLLAARGLPPAWKDVLEAKAQRAKQASGWIGLRQLKVVEFVAGGPSQSVWLECARGRALPSLAAGSYLPMALGARSNHRELSHRFALSSDPVTSRYRITAAVAEQPADSNTPSGYLSASFAKTLALDDTLLCAAPRGTLNVEDGLHGAQGLCTVTDGIGLSFAMPILYSVTRRSPDLSCQAHQVDAGDTPLDLIPEVEGLDRRGHLRYFNHDLTIEGPEPALKQVLDSLPRSTSGEHHLVIVAGAQSFVERAVDLLSPRSDLRILTQPFHIPPTNHD